MSGARTATATTTSRLPNETSGMARRPCDGRHGRLPHGPRLRARRIEVGLGAAQQVLQVLPELERRGPAPEPVPDMHLVHDQPGRHHQRVRHVRMVVRAGVLVDLEGRPGRLPGSCPRVAGGRERSGHVGTTVYGRLAALAPAVGAPGAEAGCASWPPVAPSRSAMWSATRRALAMIVSVGLTAVLHTKKLESTT